MNIMYLPVEGSGNGSGYAGLAHSRWTSETQDLSLHTIVQVTHSNELLHGTIAKILLPNNAELQVKLF